MSFRSRRPTRQRARLTEGAEQVVVTMTMGDIDVELWPKEAPLACRNFVQLCLEVSSAFRPWSAARLRRVSRSLGGWWTRV